MKRRSAQHEEEFQRERLVFGRAMRMNAQNGQVQVLAKVLLRGGEAAVQPGLQGHQGASVRPVSTSSWTGRLRHELVPPQPADLIKHRPCV